MNHKEYSFFDLNNAYAKMTVLARANCVLSTGLVGGQPGTQEGVIGYVRHHLKLTGDAAEEAADRIMTHEIPGGTRHFDPPEGGELEDSETKSVNLIRRDAYGPWIGDWMVKACLKNAGSRIGMFMDTKGSKGDVAEMGQVRASGSSLHDSGVYSANRIYLRDDSDNGPAKTQLEFFRGSVSGPQGRKSIVTLSEVCEPGARFSFEFRFFNGNIKDKDIADLFAAAMVIGLGSARSFERGKFRIEKLLVDRGEPHRKTTCRPRRETKETGN